MKGSKDSTLADLARGVFQNNIGEYCRIGLIRQVRAEADAGVEGSVEVQVDGWAELVHRLALQAYEEGEGVAVFLDADALGEDRDEAVRAGATRTAAAAHAKLHVFDADVLLHTLPQLDHARAVQRGDGLLGIILEILANDEHCLAIPITRGVWEGNVSGERNIARHLLPQIAKLIPCVPDVVTGGVDGVLPTGGVVTGAARHQSTANVRLALKDTDRGIEVLVRPVEVRGWRDLHVVCGTGLCPRGHSPCASSSSAVTFPECRSCTPCSAPMPNFPTKPSSTSVCSPWTSVRRGPAANRFLEGKPLIELYDSVVIPALGIVEQDRHKGVLDDVCCNFCFLCIGELVAELTDYQQKENGDSALFAPLFSVQEDFAVVCIAGADHADELTTHMLVQIMERASNQTLYLPASVSDEILDSLAHEPNTVIFISALPPFAFSQTRALCQRVRSHLPQNRIVIGLWNRSEDADRVQDLTVERFGSDRPTAVVNTLAQAVRQVAQWHQEAANNPSSVFRDATVPN